MLTGCATQRLPRPEIPGSEVPDQTLGVQIAVDAIAQLGRPYRYGGRDPAGFDCSGLVFFVHAAHGITTPRTTLEQYRVARPVSADALAAGDLLFFRIGATGVAHVGIYTGDGHFVHAPQTGRPVELRPVDDPYFRPRFLGAGRFY